MQKSPVAILILVCFLITSVIGPLPANALEPRLPNLRGSEGQVPQGLPKPGVRVHLSPPVTPPLLKGIKVHPDNPFRFDFILDPGYSSVADAHNLRQESSRLIKYFLASLTTPEADLWVNLSPYEKNRVVPESFGQTEMGRDLLAQDYMLKQITASLMYPEEEIGRKFWKRIYEESAKRYGTTNIPVNTFNKVWIVPEKAVVYENAKAGTAYVVESRLKVMLEEDYVASKKVSDTFLKGQSDKKVSDTFLHSQIIREVVIPELTKEINEGANFAQLRQVYSSLILATWYKKKIKDSILSKVYADQSKVQGININDPKEKDKIYQQYLQAFKKGVYNYIKEEQDPLTQKPIPRKYFSGGTTFNAQAMNAALQMHLDPSFVSQVSISQAQIVSVKIDPVSESPDTAVLDVYSSSDSMRIATKDDLRLAVRKSNNGDRLNMTPFFQNKKININYIISSIYHAEAWQDKIALEIGNTNQVELIVYKDPQGHLANVTLVVPEPTKILEEWRFFRQQGKIPEIQSDYDLIVAYQYAQHGDEFKLNQYLGNSGIRGSNLETFILPNGKPWGKKVSFGVGTALNHIGVIIDRPSSLIQGLMIKGERIDHDPEKRYWHWNGISLERKVPVAERMDGAVPEQGLGVNLSPSDKALIVEADAGASEEKILHTSEEFLAKLNNGGQGAQEILDSSKRMMTVAIKNMLDKAIAKVKEANQLTEEDLKVSYDPQTGVYEVRKLATKATHHDVVGSIVLTDRLSDVEGLYQPSSEGPHLILFNLVSQMSPEQLLAMMIEECQHFVDVIEGNLNEILNEIYAKALSGDTTPLDIACKKAANEIEILIAQYMAAPFGTKEQLETQTPKKIRSILDKTRVLFVNARYKVEVNILDAVNEIMVKLKEQRKERTQAIVSKQHVSDTIKLSEFERKLSERDQFKKPRTTPAENYQFPKEENDPRLRRQKDSLGNFRFSNHDGPTYTRRLGRTGTDDRAMSQKNIPSTREIIQSTIVISVAGFPLKDFAQASKHFRYDRNQSTAIKGMSAMGAFLLLASMHDTMNLSYLSTLSAALLIPIVFVISYRLDDRGVRRVMGWRDIVDLFSKDKDLNKRMQLLEAITRIDPSVNVGEEDFVMGNDLLGVENRDGLLKALLSYGKIFDLINMNPIDYPVLSRIHGLLNQAYIDQKLQWQVTEPEKGVEESFDFRSKTLAILAILEYLNDPAGRSFSFVLSSEANKVKAALQEHFIDNQEWRKKWEGTYAGSLIEQALNEYGLNDKAMLKRGGIDFTADETPLEISAKGGPASGWQFHIDPAMMQRLQNAPGFYPVIINIKPMSDLRQFLGLASSSSASSV